MGRYVQEPDVHFEVCFAPIHVVVDGAEKISVGCALFFRLFFLVKAGDGFDCAEGVRGNDDVSGHLAVIRECDVLWVSEGGDDSENGGELCSVA